MRKYLLAICLLFAPVPALFTSGCQHETTLEAGGVYSDVTIAKTDQAILDASHALTAFIDWSRANATYLARWPEVGQLAVKVAAQKDGWIRDAYAARDAYAGALSAYKAGRGPDPSSASSQLNAALAVLSNVTTQIVSYKSAHPQ